MDPLTIYSLFIAGVSAGATVYGVWLRHREKRERKEQERKKAERAARRRRQLRQKHAHDDHRPITPKTSGPDPVNG